MYKLPHGTHASHMGSQFSFKIKNMCMFLCLILFHFAETSSPAFEKSHSDGTGVPGI